MSELRVDKVSPRTGNYVALNTVGSKNIIINGDMSIAQRGTSVSGITATGYYTVDRWSLLYTNLGTWTQSQDSDVPSGQGFAKSLKMACTTAATPYPASNSRVIIRQLIEGQNLQYIKKGTANAESLSLSFWIKSNKTGTYTSEIYDADNTRQISKTFTINVADTWEKKTIIYAGDTTGTLNNDNTDGLTLFLWFGAGTTFTSGTFNTSWNTDVTANRVSPSQVNLADNTANYINITGVQLEAGTTASDFEFLPYDVNLQRCSRYYYKNIAGAGFTALGSGTVYSTSLGLTYLPLKTEMRSSPSLGRSGSMLIQQGATFPTISSFGNVYSGTLSAYVEVTASASSLTVNSAFIIMANNDADAYWEFNAEL